MDRQLPDCDWSIGGVNSCEVSPKVGCLPWDTNPSLAWKKANVFKINDDDEPFLFQF